MTAPPRRRHAVAALFVAAGVALLGLGPGSSTASSHREAPLIAGDPTADNTDLYSFVSPDRPGYLTFISNWGTPFQEPNGGPNFYPFATDARYLIHVDNNGDAKPDVTFRWTFQNIDRRGGTTFLYNDGPVTTLDDVNLLFRQTYTLEASFNGGAFRTFATGVPVAPSRVGRASMPNYAKLRADANKRLAGGWNTFAGQADDPFFLDLRVFDLIYGGDLSEVGQDTVAGYNINTIALQVPFEDVAINGDPRRNPVIGIWSTTERNRVRVTNSPAPVGADAVQVSRLGDPLFNEVVPPANLKDQFNAQSPDKDAGVPALVNRVLVPELPQVIQRIYNVPAPATPRNDLAQIYLTGITTKTNGPIKIDLNSQLMNADAVPSQFRPSEMLRLNLSTPVTAAPKRLGVLDGDPQGFPNGRRLTDDVLDISLQALEGAAQTGKLVPALAAGDKVDANDQPFGTSFPYVALPNVDAVNQNGSGGASFTPSAFSAGDGTPTAALAASVVTAGLGALLFTGLWLRRRQL